MKGQYKELFNRRSIRCLKVPTHGVPQNGKMVRRRLVTRRSSSTLTVAAKTQLVRRNFRKTFLFLNTRDSANLLIDSSILDSSNSKSGLLLCRELRD